MIDELIEKYSKSSIFKLAGTNVSFVETGNVKSDLLKLKEELMKEPVNLEYNRKVKLPQFATEWYKLSKNRGYSLFGALNHRNGMDNQMKLWLVDYRNQELFAKAWINGYEVEEEPKFEVVLFDNKTDRLLLMELNEHDCHADWECNNDGYRSQWFTEKQIKEFDERFWPFAVPVEEEV